MNKPKFNQASWNYPEETEILVIGKPNSEWKKELRTFFSSFHTYEELEKLISKTLQQQRQQLISEIEGIEELRLEDYVSDIEPKLTIDNLNNLNMIIKSQAKNELRKEIIERLKQITNLKEK